MLFLMLIAGAAAFPARAATVGYWEFNSGSLMSDSGPNGLTLSSYTGGTGGIVAYTLPSTGAGSAFPKTIPQTGNANSSAAIGAGGTASPSWGTNTPYVTDAPAFTLTTGVTVEAFVNLSTSSAQIGRIVASQGANGSDGSWSFGLTAADSSRGANDLIFQWQGTRGSWGTGTFTTLDSGIRLTTGDDYYIAFAMNLANTATSGAVFYVQDLTTGGPLQIVSLAHTSTTIADSSSAFDIGSGDGGGFSDWSGEIDEVRLSNTQLAQAQLLISPVPEPSAAWLLLGAGGGLFLARRKGMAIPV